MTTLLTDPSWLPTPPTICDFMWYEEPSGPLFPDGSYIVDSITYPPAGPAYLIPVAPLEAEIRFDAANTNSLYSSSTWPGPGQCLPPPGVVVVSYNWNLGNGSLATGPVATTSYNFITPPPDVQVTLSIKDSLGRNYQTTHRLNLVALTFVYGAQDRVAQGSART